MIKADFHVHTNYSDGKNTAEEMVLTAIERGFTALGFTDHAPMSDGRTWGMPAAKEPAYRQEILALKEKYKGKIDILCGLEQDFYSPGSVAGYEYAIGSVHGMRQGDKIYDVDDSLQMIEEAVKLHYDGDIYNWVEDYYRTVAKVATRIPCAIIGHIDLLTKWQEKTPLFSEEHPRYQAAAEAAVRELVPSGALFEVNCGAMSRGNRTTPYPSPKLLRYIGEQGGEIIINGDCHDKNYLGAGFEQALALVRACGFTRVVTLTSEGRKYINI
jgi:histidinol-phosphatase (PHP family)